MGALESLSTSPTDFSTFDLDHILISATVWGSCLPFDSGSNLNRMATVKHSMPMIAPGPQTTISTLRKKELKKKETKKLLKLNQTEKYSSQNIIDYHPS